MYGRAATRRPSLSVARTTRVRGLGVRTSLRLQDDLRLPNLLQPVLLVRDPRQQFIPTTGSAPLHIFSGVEGLRLLQPPLYRRSQLRFGLLHAAITHRRMLRGVGLEFRSLERDVP